LKCQLFSRQKAETGHVQSSTIGELTVFDQRRSVNFADKLAKARPIF
jgi:hypothetical protein